MKELNELNASYSKLKQEIYKGLGLIKLLDWLITFKIFQVNEKKS